MVHVFQGISRRSSRCKLGDRNLDGATMAARKQASGVWEEEKGLASPPIADAFTALDHTRERKIEEEGRKGQDAEDVASTLLLITPVSDPSPAPDAHHHHQYQWR